jgi:predicted Zn-dependent protease
MSILSGLFEDEKQVQDGMVYAELLAGEVMKVPMFRDNKFVELMREGLSPGDILNIPDDQLELVFGQAIRLMAAGKIREARKLFWTLCNMQPMERRFTYGLATTYQAEGDFRSAGRLYALFLSLDINDVEGRLRLAECFLGASEFDAALSMFRLAVTRATETGNAKQMEYAKKMIAFTQQRSASAEETASG